MWPMLVRLGHKLATPHAANHSTGAGRNRRVLHRRRCTRAPEHTVALNTCSPPVIGTSRGLMHDSTTMSGQIRDIFGQPASFGAKPAD
jgi:hypothetical protein